MTYYRKTYEVTGYTYNGAAYCVDHRPEDDGETLAVIFLGEEWDYEPTCDVCHAVIDVTVIGKAGGYGRP